MSLHEFVPISSLAHLFPLLGRRSLSGSCLVLHTDWYATDVVESSVFSFAHQSEEASIVTDGADVPEYRSNRNTSLVILCLPMIATDASSESLSVENAGSTNHRSSMCSLRYSCCLFWFSISKSLSFTYLKSAGLNITMLSWSGLVGIVLRSLWSPISTFFWVGSLSELIRSEAYSFLTLYWVHWWHFWVACECRYADECSWFWIDSCFTELVGQFLYPTSEVIYVPACHDHYNRWLIVGETSGECWCVSIRTLSLYTTDLLHLCFYWIIYYEYVSSVPCKSSSDTCGVVVSCFVWVSHFIGRVVCSPMVYLFRLELLYRRLLHTCLSRACSWLR